MACYYFIAPEDTASKLLGQGGNMHKATIRIIVSTFLLLFPILLFAQGTIEISSLQTQEQIVKRIKELIQNNPVLDQILNPEHLERTLNFLFTKTDHTYQLYRLGIIDYQTFLRFRRWDAAFAKGGPYALEQEIAKDSPKNNWVISIDEAMQKRRLQEWRNFQRRPDVYIDIRDLQGNIHAVWVYSRRPLFPCHVYFHW